MLALLLCLLFCVIGSGTIGRVVLDRMKKDCTYDTYDMVQYSPKGSSMV